MADTRLILTVNSVIDNLSDAGLPDADPEINIFTTEGTLTSIEGGLLLSFSLRAISAKIAALIKCDPQSLIARSMNSPTSSVMLSCIPCILRRSW